MRVAGGEGTRIIRILPGLPADSRQAGVRPDAERYKVKRNLFAFPQKVGKSHVITWAKSFRRRSTLCRGPRSNERNFPPVAVSNFGLGYQNGKTRFDAERNFPLSAGPKSRLSDPAGTCPQVGTIFYK